MPTDGQRKAIEGHTGLDVVSLFIVVGRRCSPEEQQRRLEAPSAVRLPVLSSEWTEATRVWDPN